MSKVCNLAEFLLGKIALAQASHPFLLSVCLSVCRLSDSCTLLKPLDGFTRHLAGGLHLRGQVTRCASWGCFIPVADWV